jgi:hypothetical protein
MSGCPGHTATLDFNSIAASFRFEDGKGHALNFHETEMIALLDMLRELAGWRVEAENILRSVCGAR